jgi:hypothetical protein
LNEGGAETVISGLETTVFKRNIDANRVLALLNSLTPNR